MSELNISRRQFLLTMGATTAGAVVFTGCAPMDKMLAQSRVQLAEDIVSAYENWYASTCKQCEAGCGTITRVVSGRAKKVEGNPDHPVNRGKLCARGQAAVQEQYHPDRLREPMRRTGERGAGSFTPISWDEALDELVQRLRNAQGNAALVTPPLRAHHALVAERFTTAHGARWLRLDPVPELPFHEAAGRVFGQELLPQLDIQNSQYILSFGADFLSTWQSPVHYGVGYGIFRQGNYYLDEFQPRQRPRGYFVQIDPRFSMTAASADEWVPVRPGAEGALALSIAQVLLADGLADPAGAQLFDAGALEQFAPDRVEQLTGVAADRVRQIAHDFAERRPSVAFGGGAVGAQTNGTATLSAVLALNQLVGSVGVEGGVQFSPPSPIADLPAPFRASGVAEWQQLIQDLQGGQVELLLVHQADPVYGLPPSLGFGQALEQAPFIVSFSSFMDDTTAHADLILPSHVALEDWGADVPDPSPGLQVVTMQQPVVIPLYNTRSFWDVLLTAGEELGGPVAAALPWRSFRELLQQGAHELHELGRGSVQAGDFEQFWVRLLQHGGWWDQAPPPEAEVPGAETIVPIPAPEFDGSAQDYPFHLILFPHNTLGGGSTAHLPWLQAAPDPVTTVVWQTWVEVNPRVAAEMGLREGDVVGVESTHGRIDVPVYIHPAAPPNVLAIPAGQGHQQFGRWARGRGANPLTLLAPLADEATGALAYAATRVRLVRTERRVSVPKFEGGVPAVQLEHEEVIRITRPEEA